MKKFFSNIFLILFLYSTPSSLLAMHDPSGDPSSKSGPEVRHQKQPDYDARYKITHTKEYPHYFFGDIVCHRYDRQGNPILNMRGQPGLYGGSGTLVGPNIVLTAAHVLYDKEERGEARVTDKDFCFYPGKCGREEPYGKFRVAGFYYPKEYKRDVYPSEHD